ncbi:hypothetical protein EYB45_04055 [Erythrobacteraceae bacterium CFH 75059]|uniref:hypothetical protein n=1 Tax=Qipengyuania thermophila TaxID=2509361 RepID=UPI00101F499A|nr:hypothetical protein [Qipengyuania thermophila]TCD06856.1 hypothetical protein EYB45_04055 [Erythrobacteraceae bacterium CFH 75059]
MAEIPVEKKGGVPGWVWALLALLVGALLLWLLLGDRDRGARTATTTTTEQTTATASPTPLTTAAAAGAAATAFTPGQSVDLNNFRVTALEGDMAFRGEADGRELFVVFDEVATADPRVEGQIDVRPGQILNLSGVIRPAGEPMPAGVQATVPQGVDQYLMARRIEVVR